MLHSKVQATEQQSVQSSVQSPVQQPVQSPVQQPAQSTVQSSDTHVYTVGMLAVFAIGVFFWI